MDTIKRRRQLLLTLLGAPCLATVPVAATAAVLGSAPGSVSDVDAALVPKLLPGVPLPPRPPRGPRGPRGPYVPAPRRVLPRGPRKPRIPRP